MCLILNLKSFSRCFYKHGVELETSSILSLELARHLADVSGPPGCVLPRALGARALEGPGVCHP